MIMLHDKYRWAVLVILSLYLLVTPDESDDVVIATTMDLHVYVQLSLTFLRSQGFRLSTENAGPNEAPSYGCRCPRYAIPKLDSRVPEVVKGQLLLKKSPSYAGHLRCWFSFLVVP